MLTSLFFASSRAMGDPLFCSFRRFCSYEQASLVSQSFVLHVTFFSRNALYCSFKALSFSLSCDFGKPVALFFSRLWPIVSFFCANPVRGIWIKQGWAGKKKMAMRRSLPSLMAFRASPSVPSALDKIVAWNSKINSGYRQYGRMIFSVLTNNGQPSKTSRFTQGRPPKCWNRWNARDFEKATQRSASRSWDQNQSGLRTWL